MKTLLDKLSSGVVLPFTPLLYNMYACEVRVLMVHDPMKAMMLGAVYKAKCDAFMEERKRERERTPELLEV